jgi:hypothetical protein
LLCKKATAKRGKNTASLQGSIPPVWPMPRLIIRELPVKASSSTIKAGKKKMTGEDSLYLKKG